MPAPHAPRRIGVVALAALLALAGAPTWAPAAAHAQPAPPLAAQPTALLVSALFIQGPVAHDRVPANARAEAEPA